MFLFCEFSCISSLTTFVSKYPQPDGFLFLSKPWDPVDLSDSVPCLCTLYCTLGILTSSLTKPWTPCRQAASVPSFCLLGNFGYSRVGRRDLFSGIPRTTLRFRVSLEGLTELRKAMIFTVVVYDSKRIQVTIRQVKTHKAEPRKETTHDLVVVLSPCIYTVWNSPSKQRVTTPWIIAIWEAHLSLGVQHFYWGSVM